MELAGVRALEIHRSLPSTNDRAREWIREGVHPVVVVVAAEQTRGRGRGGRAWLSPAGEGLWMSVVLEARDPESTRLLPLRVGLALARGLDAMPERAGLPALRLKWPNDLFSDQGKVGGILCESLGDRLVVGVGLNCRPPDVSAPYPVAGLGGVDPDALLPVATAAVLEASARTTACLRSPEVAEWRERDLLAGSWVEAEEGTGGTAKGIDVSGRLLLAGPDGAIRTVITGSVRPGQPRSS